MFLVQTACRRRIALGGLAAALALAALIGLTPRGQALAAQFLTQFRGERFAVVPVDPGQAAAALAQLEQLGTLRGGRAGGPARAEAEEVKTIAEASQRVGFPVKQPEPAALPAGLGQAPRIRVLPAAETRFTFERDKARAYFQALGHPDVSLPDRFDGASLVVSVPPVVVLQYDGPGLVVGQARVVTVGVEGNVTLDELRDFLLGLPGLPPETVRQLRAIQDWRNTLPIPVPVDQVAWRATTIAGGPGLVLADTSGLGSGALWQRDGRVYGVAGPFPSAEIQRVADSLR
jgi:hypothetical protein